MSTASLQRPPTPARTDLHAARTRRTGRRWGVALLLLTLWAVVASGIGRDDVVNVGGWPTMVQFWSAAANPDLAAEHVRRTLEASVTTLAFAALGTVLAVVIGLVGGVLLSARWWAADPLDGPGRRAGLRTGWITGRLLSGIPRGVHEAVWGLFLLTFLGRDPLVGVLAIAIPFGAITAKVYAELIDETASGPEQALRAQGSGALVRYAYSVLPLVQRDLVAYAFYRFDCALRSAIILGMVGAGGLGFEFIVSFQALAYERLWTLIYALVILGAFVDAWSSSLRLDPSPAWVRGSLGLALAGCVGAVVHLGPSLERLVRPRTWNLLADTADRAWPPQLPVTWARLWEAVAATVQMSVLAIVIGSLVGLVAAVIGARHESQGPVRRGVGALARLVLLVMRALSVPVWALIVLFVVFPGLLPGAIALGLYNAGVLGRLFAEVIENLDHRPVQALVLGGATGTTAFFYGTFPLVAPKMLAYALYRWEVAIRDTVIVGVVGAGGLGRILEERRAAFDLPGMLTIVLVLLVLAVVVDFVSAAARRSLRVGPGVVGSGVATRGSC